LIHAPDLGNVGCLAHVNVIHDQTRQKGLITIGTDLKLAGRNDEYQSIHLNILPQTIVAVLQSQCYFPYLWSINTR
jgi:hypothetical protein